MDSIVSQGFFSKGNSQPPITSILAAGRVENFEPIKEDEDYID